MMMDDLKNEKIRLSTRKNLITGLNSHLGICETLRMTYDLIDDMEDKELKEQITDKLVNAMIMAKKVIGRLDYYRKKYDDKTGSSGEKLILLPNHVMLKELRGKRKYE
jgi:hypothetical protein